MAHVSTKLLSEKKVWKLKRIKTKKQCKHLQSLADYGDKTSSSGRFRRPDFQKRFPLTIFFLLLLASKCLVIFVNCVTKCVMAKIYRMKVRILQTFFLNSLYVQFNSFINKFETSLTNKKNSKYFFFVFYSKLRDV